MIIKKKHTREEIKTELLTHAASSGYVELRFVLAYALGYYGVIDEEIWDVVNELIREDVVKC